MSGDYLVIWRGGGINGRYRSTECPHHRHFQPLSTGSHTNACVRFLVGVLHYVQGGGRGAGGGGVFWPSSDLAHPPVREIRRFIHRGKITLLKGLENGGRFYVHKLFCGLRATHPRYSIDQPLSNLLASVNCVNIFGDGTIKGYQAQEHQPMAALHGLVAQCANGAHPQGQTAP